MKRVHHYQKNNERPTENLALARVSRQKKEPSTLGGVGLSAKKKTATFPGRKGVGRLYV